MEQADYNVHSGTFYYQRRAWVKAINLITLTLCLIAAGVANYVFSAHVVVTVLVFFAALVVLAIIFAPITERYFYCQGKYTFTPDKISLRLGKDIEISRADVKFIRCYPLRERKGIPDRTWCLQITMSGGRDIYRIYSLDLEVNNETRAQRVKDFLTMASYLCEVEGGSLNDGKEAR